MCPLSQGRRNRSAAERPSAFDKLDEVKARINQASGLLLFLDFDGTLAPIVAQPARAALPSATRQLLNELAELRGITIAIVSGRALADITQRVGICALIYAGNHGLEIEGRGLSFTHPRAAELAPELCKIAASLFGWSNVRTGVEVEPKGLTTSLHYRRASTEDQLELERFVRAIVPPDDPNFEIRNGKMVYEIRPRVDWDKGKAMEWLRDQLGQPGALPIVAGDDITDEDAFTAFDNAVTICVSPRQPTAASYQLGSPDDVRAFLDWLVTVWKNGLGDS
jgi:trehalose 6-phosphate phosphatase